MHKDLQSFKYLVGVDEVGRGSLAGPVAVGAFWGRKETLVSLLGGIKDSKKLLPAKREEWFSKLKNAQKEGCVGFAVAFCGVRHIDTRGIQDAIRHALRAALAKLPLGSEHSFVFLDGGLVAPAYFRYQETIIKGDEKVPVIAAASIVAKVLRDRRMVQMGKKYPEYGFEKHKGYGTLRHVQNIQKNGPSPYHRVGFLGNFNLEI